MKAIRSSVLTVICVVVVLACFWIVRGRIARQKQAPPPVAQQLSASDAKPVAGSGPASFANGPNRNVGDMTDGEKAELAQKFKEKLKPALHRWYKAYEGHIPFNPEDLTLDKFKQRMGRNPDFYLYSFVIDGTTLTIQESKETAKVFYMMTSAGANELNRLPNREKAPSLNIPVSRENVIRCVKADTGVEFKPSEVLMKPTGAATALNGGAFVELLPTGADPNNGLSSKIDLVFGPDGNLVSYQRDPFF